MPPFEDALRELEATLQVPSSVSIVKLAVLLVIGGVLGLILRLMYRVFSSSPAGTDSITRVFPLLVIVTCGVIAVVKSSLALSLGLVGALSIVRFRAAIKDPEELVYLFLCIALGLSLGAELPWLAISLVVVATVFIVGMHFTSRKRLGSNLMLTVTTRSSEDQAAMNESELLKVIDEVAGRHILERVDVENGVCQVRVMLGNRPPEKTAKMLDELRERVPGGEFSFVNMNSIF